jgi:hypothetical protein
MHQKCLKWFNLHNIMPLETRNAKKGIPPKQHQPRGTKKAGADRNGKTKQTRTTRKRSASKSGSESSDSDSEHEAIKKTKKHKRSKRRHVPESENEVEEVAADVEPLDVEHVDDTMTRNGQSDENGDSVSGSSNHHVIRILKAHKWQEHEDGLNDHQRGTDLHESVIKKDSTRDLLTVMSDRVKVKFLVGKDKYEMEMGRWCYLCK